MGHVTLRPRGCSPGGPKASGTVLTKPPGKMKCVERWFGKEACALCLAVLGRGHGPELEEVKSRANRKELIHGRGKR